MYRPVLQVEEVEAWRSDFHIPHYNKIHAWDKGNKKAGNQSSIILF